MSRAYDEVFNRVLTRLDPEQVHHLTASGLQGLAPVARRLAGRLKTPGTPVSALGLTFPNVLGMAGGFDKNAVAIDALASFGFGHVEIGTVTGEPQPGNPKPRLFRLPEDRAIINRMGFNNDGAEAVAARLAARAAKPARGGPILGVNIGKTKVVPEEHAIADYEKSTRLLAPHADYLVVNVSSPNTPGLRDLQAVEKLAPLLAAVRRTADAAGVRRRVPLLVKIAPDLDDADVTAVAELALTLELDGIIATNTTIRRDGLRSPQHTEEVGGLSGEPVKERALAVLGLLKARTGDRLTLIGVGGISTAADARARLAAGADLLQAYTGLIYGGPAWPRRIVNGIEMGADQ